MSHSSEAIEAACKARWQHLNGIYEGNRWQDQSESFRVLQRRVMIISLKALEDFQASQAPLEQVKALALQQWENVAPNTHRFKVPGGWLYGVFAIGSVSLEIVFVPRPLVQNHPSDLAEVQLRQAAADVAACLTSSIVFIKNGKRRSIFDPDPVFDLMLKDYQESLDALHRLLNKRASP